LKSSVQNVIKYILFSALGFGILYMAFKGVDLKELWHEMLSVNLWWVVLSLFFAFLGYFSRAMRWKILINPLGYNPSLKHTFFSLMLGYFVNLALPRAGEFARCAALQRSEHVPVDKLFGTVIIERVIDLCMLILLGLVVLCMKIDLFEPFIQKHIFTAFTDKITAIPLLYLIGAVVVIIGFVILLLISRNTFKVSRKIINFAKGIIDGLKSIYIMKNRSAFIFHTLFIWFMYWAMTYVVFFAVDATEGLDMIDGLFILIVGGLGMSAPVQSGMGVFHYIVAQALIIYGLDYSEGLLYATVSHESQMIFVIGMGLLSMWVFSKIKKTNEKSSTDTK
jgi:uncharacterized protein (TIRG00374 family)